jgi:integrase
MASKTNETQKYKKKDGSVKEYRYARSTKTIGTYLNAEGKEKKLRIVGRGPTKKDAIEDRDKKIERARGKKNSNDFVPFRQIADEYMYSVFLVGNDADATKEKYLTVYEQYLQESDVSDLPVSSIVCNDFQEILNTADCAYSTLRVISNVVRRIYKYIEVEKNVPDITRNLQVPRRNDERISKNKEIIIWEPDEFVAVITNLGSWRYRLLVLFSAYTGCRISELLAVKYNSISDGKLLIARQTINKVNWDSRRKFGKKKGDRKRVTSDILKTKGSYREIPLSDELLSEINTHREKHEAEMKKKNYETDYMFTTKSGKLIDHSNITKALKRYCKRIGVEYKSFHKFRDTFATMLANGDADTQGTPIAVVAAILGHINIATTARYYIKVSDYEKRNAISRIRIPR